MYLHVGSETIVDERNIIGIFDIDNTSVSKLTRDFLRKKQDAGRVVNVTNDIPKTFIVCQAPNSRETVYLSQLAAATLKKRSGRL